MPYLAAAFICVLLALVGRLSARTWLHPAPLFAASWAVFLTIPALFVGGIRPAPTASFLICVFVACVAASSRVTVRHADRVPRVVIVQRPLRRLVVVGGLAGILAAMLAASGAGLSPFGLFTLSGVQHAGLVLAVNRYDTQASLSTASVLLLAVNFSAAAVAPFAAAAEGLRRRKRVLLTVWPLVGGSMFSVATTARQAMLVSAGLTLAASLMVAVVKAGGPASVHAKRLLGTLVVGGVVAYLFVFAAFSRVGSYSENLQAVVYHKLGIYAAGPVPAFDSWVTGGSLNSTPQLGLNTFAGVVKYFVGKGSAGGAFNDFTSVETNGPAVTNIYTLFRQLIADFTFVGAFLVLTVAAFLAAYAYRRMVMRGSAGAAVGVTAFIAGGFYSSTGSLFASTNICAGLLLARWAMRKWVVLAVPGDVPAAEPAPAGKSRRRAAAPVATARPRTRPGTSRRPVTL